MVPSIDDLIVACATPPGHGALAVVRLSGPGAIPMAASICGRTRFRPRHATFTRLALVDDLVDHAVVTCYPHGASYTGEESVEFSTHGSPVIVDALLRTCVAYGARPARAGEFTLRAHLNGRLDLVQAEAVADIVAATTAAQARVASSHLSGDLSGAIRGIGDGIAEVRALLEASLDFPDEGFHFLEPGELALRLARLRESCEALVASADAGRRLREGASVVIVGRPNAGKSSLFNALLGRERAIVADQPGTTRDVITESLALGGVPVVLTDTAGIRETGDAVEQLGVERAGEARNTADVLLVAVNPGAAESDLDASRTLWADAKAVASAGAVCVLTHGDVASVRPVWAPDDAVTVSSRTREGIEALRDRLGGLVGRADWHARTLMRPRQRLLVERCVLSLRKAEDAVASGASEEFVLVDVHDALHALDELRGVETPSEVLEQIFGTFCIGK